MRGFRLIDKCIYPVYTTNVNTPYLQKRDRMGRKIYRTGNSLVVTLPKDALDRLRMSEGTEVDVQVNEEQGVLIISPTEGSLEGVSEAFASQVEQFIEEYREALEELARSP